jgi:hypothetical protein
LGAFVWLVIMIALGAWTWSGAERREYQERQADRQAELLERMASRLDEKEKGEPR